MYKFSPLILILHAIVSREEIDVLTSLQELYISSIRERRLSELFSAVLCTTIVHSQYAHTWAVLTGEL